MKTYPFFLILFLTVLTTGQEKDVRFYLSEEDFLSSTEISENRLGRSPFLEVHYDSDGRVILKRMYRRMGKLAQFEELEYDSVTREITFKTVYDADGTLLRRFIFGPGEEMSEKYIRYVYGVKGVEKFPDRFTGVEYLDGKRPSHYRFFDVDAFLYGVMKLSYGIAENVRQEDWVAMPGNRLMRRYLFEYQPDTGTTEIWEYDSTMALVMRMTVDSEGYAPLYEVSFPRDSASVNRTLLTYSLLERLREGRVVWEWKGGNPDTLVPHVIDLVDPEMERGKHVLITLRNSPVLVDSAVYDIRFTGVGELGYPAREIVLHDITFDTTAPVYSFSSDPVVNRSEISYSLGEALLGADVIWVWERGARDRQSPHTVGLSRGLLSEGDHDEISFEEELQLNDGTVYTLLFGGKDLAGNLGPVITVGGIRYDATPPVITWVRPDTGYRVSSSGVSYTLSEDLAGGEMTWRQVSGEPDSLSPQTATLTGTETKEGKHQYVLLRESPVLADGSVYELTIHGVDQAGNVSDTITVPNVLCDLTPPTVNIHHPITDGSARSAEVVYSLTENLASARIQWQQIIEDSLVPTPQVIMLDSVFLAEGDHRMVDEEISSTFKDGSRYRITFTGRDLAGNEAIPFEIGNVLVDASPPVFANLYPNDTSFVSSSDVSFSLSETLTEGAVIWTQLAGNFDPGSPHIADLTTEEKQQGDHTGISLSNAPNLNDGSIYEVSFMGVDAAGNRSSKAVITDVVYDISPPEMAWVYPASGSFVQTAQLTFRLSETLKEGKVTWTWTGGNPDTASPHVVSLVEEELLAGHHERIFLTHSPVLAEGAVYSVIIEGKDFGDKPAVPVETESIRFDSEPPEVALISPVENSYVNSPSVRYGLSEPLTEGTIIFTRAGGKEDTNSPHVIALQQSELGLGDHGDVPLVNSPVLVSGSSYDLAFFGYDSAGNASDTLRISNIQFDRSPPAIDLAYPTAYTPTSTHAIGYTLSEELSEAAVSWIWTGGANDPAPAGEHIQLMSGDELASGEHGESILQSAPPAPVEGGIYSIVVGGKDLAGNEAISAQIPGVLYDATAPSFSDVSPSSGEYMNSPKVVYSLSEPLEKGTVIWRQTGGREDPNSPHVVTLEGEELDAGLHERTVLKNSPSLQDSSVYSIFFTGIDGAANRSDTIAVENVLYDVTPPSMEVGLPVTGTYVSRSTVSYVLSEDLSEGSITWDRTGGSEDPDSPHTRSLTGSELVSGQHLEIELSDAPVLAEGASYTVTISGMDRAGNRSVPVAIPDVGFDLTKPRFADVTPLKGAFVNHAQVSYALSELLKDGLVQWTRIGGAEDPNAPHVATLIGEELIPGPHPPKQLEESPLLQDGSLYSIWVFGTDAAGNVSDTAKADSITYDVTNPEFTLAWPEANSYIRSPVVSYWLSEDLAEGAVIWERTGGSIDEESPHLVSLEGSELSQGEHLETLLSQAPGLTDGTTYNLTLSGKDRAGNEISPSTILSVTYDGIPPSFTGIWPTDSISVNSSRVSYTLSESLEKGQLIWTRIADREDAGSPHIVNFAEDEMAQGQHTEVVLANQSSLQDGSVYDIAFLGMDAAGNASDTLTISNITYDTTPPSIELTHPAENMYIPSADVGYSLSENLYQGSITWEWKEGTADPDAPHVRELADSALVAGDHEEVVADPPVLVDGGVYSVTVAGVDLAGNSAVPVVASQVTFDATPPVVQVVYPEPGSHVNSARVSYVLSESFAGGRISWTHVGGVPDPSSPYEITLEESELTGGEHMDIIPVNAPGLQDGSVYKLVFTGTDFGGNESDAIEVAPITFDTSVPTISVSHPESVSFVNNLAVSYRLSEPLRGGTATWERISGTQDPQSPHAANLIWSELDSGIHSNVVLSNVPSLVDGATYSISFSGIDSAGNSSDTILVDEVTFDETPPVFLVQSPEDSSFRNHTRLSYTVSESLAEGKASWTQTGGSPDGASPHVIDLTGEELAAGEHEDIVLSQPISLADGAIYTVEVDGRDRAGNQAETLLIHEVQHDISPPSYRITEPDTGSYVNSPVVSYQIDEQLTEATITWERIGGAEDPGSPHEVVLPREGLSAGVHRTSEFVDLANGSEYSVTLQGNDLAGNDGEGAVIPGITFDSRIPVISVDGPQSETPVNSTVLSYTLFEDLSSGKITWTRTGGAVDPDAPHESSLEGDELSQGEHLEIELSQIPSLTDGAIYDVAFDGADLAGNEAETVLVTSVTYDTTAPTIVLTSPSAGITVNTPEMSYELSENIRAGTVTWQRVGGIDDPGSPYSANLVGRELSGGAHEAIILAEAPQLVDGVSYDISLEGTDLAGNTSQAVGIDQVTFDVTPPVIVANYPPPSSTVNTSRVSYSLSEELAAGNITWRRTGGSEDPESPHVQPLSGPEMTVGDHQDIVLTSPPKLVNDGVYSLIFDGSDAAGNRASGMIIESVTFDSTKPVFVLQIPGDRKYINEPRITYSLSETLAEGKIIWVRESGAEDPGSPHVLELAGEELAEGEHMDVLTTATPKLQDRSVYSVTLAGADRGGSQGDSVTVSGILYDALPPVLTLESPQPNTSVKTLQLTYGIDEDLAEGTLTWTRTSGAPDPASPHTIPLDENERKQGTYEGVILANQTDLTDGAVYSVVLSGSDLAGNSAEIISVESVQFDTTSPQFSQIMPASGSYINKLEMSYTLSETLSISGVVWTRTGGVDDPGSPHETELVGEELFAGRHEGIVLANAPDLVSSASYSVSFAGEDRAGNRTEVTGIEELTFDNTQPVFTVALPGSSAYVNHSLVSYEISEPIARGTISWLPKNGGSPQVQSLTGMELEEGVHESIQLSNSPNLEDGGIYDIRFEGADAAGNEVEPIVVGNVTYDVTIPRIKVTLDSPAPRTFKKDTPLTISNSEAMSEITFFWEREGGADDPNSPHTLPVSEENLTEGEHSNIVIPGADLLLVGTVYTLTVRGQDFAGNESKPQKVESIDMIRKLGGDWLSKTALLTAVWSFGGRDQFSQGVMMGTRISQKEAGEVTVDFSKRPFEIGIDFESGVRRYAIFEFTGPNSMRVVIGEKRPKSWTDGDLMEFEFSEQDVP